MSELPKQVAETAEENGPLPNIVTEIAQETEAPEANPLWKPIQNALLKKESTTELETDEVSKVHEQLMLALIDKHPEIDYVDFPSQETTESYYQSFEK